MEFADKSAISELINAWGVYRDQAKWKELRGTFTPDGHISVSWFRSVRAVRRALPHELCGKPRLVAPSPVHADDHARERSRDRRDAGGHPGAPEVRHRRSRSDVLFPFFRPCRAPRRGLADRRARRDLRARPPRSGRAVGSL